MNQRSLTGLIAFSLMLQLVICLAPVRAEETDPARGRLPDGRAYRTDGEGNQLIDYIAELELEKEGLEGRIFNLQDKLRVSEAQQPLTVVKQEQQSCPTCPRCDSVAPAEPQSCPPISCPAVACPRIDAVECPSCTDTSDEIRSLERKVTQLNSEFSENEAERDLERTSLNDDIAQCKAEVARVQSSVVSYQESVTDLRKALSDREDSLQAARAQVASLRQEQQRLVAARQAGDAESSRASFGATSNGSQLSNSALSSARAQLQSRLVELKSQVRARDEQFKLIDQRGKALQVRPAALKTRSGFELKDADEAIKKAANFKTIAEISRELDTLTRIVSDDIVLGARLAKR